MKETAAADPGATLESYLKRMHGQSVRHRLGEPAGNLIVTSGRVNGNTILLTVQNTEGRSYETLAQDCYVVREGK